MKRMLALVVLLHFCCSAVDTCVDLNLNNEMIRQLDDLNKFCKTRKGIVRSALQLSPAKFPSMDMQKRAYSCLHTFVTELKHLLDKMTTAGVEGNLIGGLKANLLILQSQIRADQQTGNYTCQMETSRWALNLFKPYSTFLKKLNVNKPPGSKHCAP